MIPPTTYLERLVERQSSFLFFGNFFYSLEPSSQPSENTFHSFGFIQPLVRSLPFDRFEALDERMQSPAIKAYCKDYIAESINRELKAEQEIRAGVAKIKALEFIMYELLPHLVSRNYTDTYTTWDALFGKEVNETATIQEESVVERAKRTIAEKLHADFGVHEQEQEENVAERLRLLRLRKEKESVKTDPLFNPAYTLEELGVSAVTSPSILGNITAHQPFYVVDGRVFSLDREDQKGDIFFMVHGKRYVPGKEIEKLSTFIGTLKTRTLQKWQITALETSRDAFAVINETITDSKVKQHELRELSKLNEYDIEGCGFIARNDNYYVYVTLPKFATQDFRNPTVFWPYEQTKVAIHIGWQDGQVYTTGKPVVVEQREYHPCMYKRDRPFSDICNLEDRNYSPGVQGMVDKLSDGRNVVETPLSKVSLDAHTGYTYFGVHLDNILRQGSLTREDAEKKDYRVIEVVAQDA